MYEITIVEITQEKKMAGKDWETIGTDDNDKPIRGYTPEIEKWKDVTREIYKQIVEELDLVSVINAINS